MYFCSLIPNTMNKGILFASFTALLWGILAIALKVSVYNLSPIDVTWFRFTLAFITLSAFYLLFDKSKLGILKAPPFLSILAAISLGLNYLGFISGIKYTTPAIAQIFMQSGPVLFAVTGFIIFKEKASVRQIFGLITVLLGLLVFYHEQILVLADDIKQYNKGIAWVFFGAVSWVFYATLQKPVVQRYNPMQLNLILFGIPALGYFPFVNLSLFPQQNFAEWLLLIFLGLNTLAAYGFLAYALKYLEANKISVIITCNPIITFITMAILGYLKVSWIQPEKFSFLTILGATVVIAGVILAVIKRKK